MLAHPIQIDATALDRLRQVVAPLLVLLSVALVASGAQQFKWFLAGGAISLVALILTLSGLHTSQFVVLRVIGDAGFLAIVALPLGIGIGILKYRLYEIDRLISRTLSYAILTGFLVAVFAGLVVVSTDVLPFASPVGVAASTLATAALFNPFRRRIQRIVDHRFNRSGYDAEALVAAFSTKLRDAVDLTTIHDELLEAVVRSVEPSGVSLLLTGPAPR